MSMHDEFERAIAGSSDRKRGLGALGWLAITLGMFVVVGVVGVGFAMNRVSHTVEDMLVGFDYDAGAAAAKIVSRMESHTRLLSADPEEGLEFLRSLDGDDPTGAFLGSLFGGSLDRNVRFGKLAELEELAELKGLAELEELAELQDLAELAESDALAEARSTRVRRGDGDVSLDLRGSGGSLVIRSDDGEVRLDLRRSEDGASLVIDSDDGRARIDLQRTAGGGYLTVDSDEGRVRFDLIRSDEGGQLLVETDDGEALRLAFGEDADALPRWVPAFDGMPERPRPVYSLSADKGTLGAVAWKQDASANTVLDWFQAELEEAGYDIRAEHHRDGARFDEGSLWAKDESTGRLVFVVAHENDEGTAVLLGYGQEAR